MTEKANILIVDDELGPRESLRMILKPLYNVYTAEDGSKALDLVKKVPIDLITLDLRMPELSGIEVLKEAKNADEDIEVVIITGYGTLETITIAGQYGIYDYISKPFNVADVLSIVEKSIQKKKNSCEVKKLLQDIGSVTGSSKMDRLQKIIEKSVPLINQLRAKGHFAAGTKKESVDLNYLKFLKLLSHLLENDATSLAEHAERIHNYTSLFFDELSFSAKEKEELEIASYFHDIGKLGLELNYAVPVKTMQQKEYQLWKEHPEKAIEVLKPLGFSDNILAIILHHHESYNGEGFPHGLKGENIPLGARMLRIANVYDALLLAAPYPDTLANENAVRDMNTFGEGWLDPHLLQVFLKALPSQGRRS